MTSLRTISVAIIGAGNMGQALCNGLVSSDGRPSRLAVVESDPTRRRMAHRRYGVRAISLGEAARRCGVIIVAVKPQDLATVLAELRGLLGGGGRGVLLISIAAGVPCATIERMVGRVPVVRVMPNLPATVGCGISAITGGRHATAAHRAAARAIFACVGEVVELPERLFDVVTAVSGSGPAYYFVMFKALCDVAVRAGMPAAVARTLAVQTARGSAELASASEETFEKMIARVASKKGTTEAALRVLRRRRFAGILEAAVRAAAHRSQQLRRR